MILKNETILNEMVDILDSAHKYVPTKKTTQEFDVQNGGATERVTVEVDHFHHIMFGGDQLTAARICSTQSIRSNS